MKHIISFALYNHINAELLTEILVFQDKEMFLKGIISFLYNHYVGEDYDSSLQMIEDSQVEVIEEDINQDDDYTLVIAAHLLTEYKKYLSLTFNSENIKAFIHSVFDILGNEEIQSDFQYLQIE